MSESFRFKIRFMQPDETDRLAELIGSLQSYQKLSGVQRIPNGQEAFDELTSVQQVPDGQARRLGNSRGTFTAFVIDTTKPKDDKNKSYIVGYIVYSQKYSIIHGRQLYLNSFFIEEGYRFHGLGKILIEFMQRHGELLGNDRFDVPFMLNNTIGRKFYGKMGAYLVPQEYNLAKVGRQSLKSMMEMTQASLPPALITIKNNNASDRSGTERHTIRI